MSERTQTHLLFSNKSMYADETNEIEKNGTSKISAQFFVQRLWENSGRFSLSKHYDFSLHAIETLLDFEILPLTVF